MESSDKEDEEDDGTSDKDINDDGDGGGNRNTGAIGGSAEWLRLFIPGSKTEQLGAMKKAKAFLSTASRKKLNLEKVRVK